MSDLFTHRATTMVAANADHFTAEFVAYLPGNLHVYDAFEEEALHVVAKGFKHYSARTIIEALRHHSALQDVGCGHWKLNDWHTPYFARLFALVNPANEGLFEFRHAKAARRMPGGAH
ncbi:hypothetical protein RCH10_000795 [Variovorax sp. GrIS 2.14]|uniref:hypothetical protein n=1 Tax=Variovorax sp. GrIS 2.14 TaxID=3071709 RepID=UPI0038F6CCF5